MKTSKRENIWVVVPVFNESRALPQFLSGLLKYPYSVVVVDDGSKDESADIAKKFSIPVLTHSANAGQGAALRTGIAYALQQGAQVIVTMDADGQMNPADISSLIAPVAEGLCDIALGNRFGSVELGASGLPFFRKHILKAGTWVLWAVAGLKLHDSQNGFRALSRSAAESIRIRQNRMAHNWEILFQSARRKLRIQEVPVHISYSKYSLHKGQKLRDVFQILWDLIFK